MQSRSRVSTSKVHFPYLTHDLIDRQLDKARKCFEEAMESVEARESCFSALGMIDYFEGNLESSIDWLHKVRFPKIHNEFIN